jgi:hypothetical protein
MIPHRPIHSQGFCPIKLPPASRLRGDGMSSGEKDARAKKPDRLGGIDSVYARGHLHFSFIPEKSRKIYENLCFSPHFLSARNFSRFQSPPPHSPSPVAIFCAAPFRAARKHKPPFSAAQGVASRHAAFHFIQHACKGRLNAAYGRRDPICAPPHKFHIEKESGRSA